ncbi:MAG TPA: pectinesterase family protein [Longimicrobium sp.]|nr:pectinesterase family protein [Longimicrobium sp.]
MIRYVERAVVMALAISTIGVTAPAAAQSVSAMSAVLAEAPDTLLAPSRIAALPAAERQAWVRYVETSRRQAEMDRASIQRNTDGGDLPGIVGDSAAIERLRGGLHTVDADARRTGLRALDRILQAQFPNGCWPGTWPLRGGEDDAARFSGGTVTGILRLLRDVAGGEAAWMPAHQRQRAGMALERGIGCILDAQVVVDGRRTGWGARHDPLTLAPIGGASEPAGLSAAAGPAIARLLMEVDSSDPRVAVAIRGAAAWMRESMLWGIAQEAGAPLRAALDAGPAWARVYEIGSNRALWARDGLARYDWRQLPDDAARAPRLTVAPAEALARYEAWTHAHAAPLPARTGRVGAVVDARHGGADGAPVAGLPTYRTLGAALAAAPAAGREAFVIHLRDGRYREKLSVTTPNVHLVGESRDGTVLTFDVAAGHASPGGWPYGTRGSWTLRIAAPGFRMERMTVENAWDYPANDRLPDTDSGKLRGSQAVAVMLDEGSDRAVFRDCVISGNQDTLFPNAGRAYFAGCTIRGTVDFIFGWGRAVFQDCDIVSRDRGSATDNGYITAPSTHVRQPYGFVFYDSWLRKESPSMAPNSVTLGRPWHTSGSRDAIGSAVFIRTWMDDHVGAKGWDVMTSTDAASRRVEHRPEDARFYEHASTGPGAVLSPSRRVLTAEQAAAYDIVRVLDGWDPRS